MFVIPSQCSNIRPREIEETVEKITHVCPSKRLTGLKVISFKSDSVGNANTGTY